MERMPVEILCQIFDNLDLADIKNASLTCRRWETIIFSEPFNKRFVQSDPEPSEMTNLSQLRVLRRNSWRTYSGLHLNLTSYNGPFLKSSIYLFSAIRDQPLDRFRFVKVTTCDFSRFIPELRLVLSVISRFSNLQELHVLFKPHDFSCLPLGVAPLSFRSDSLENLRLTNLASPIMLHLPRLKRLHLGRTPTGHALFARLKFDVRPTTNPLLRTICDQFSGLVELNIFHLKITDHHTMGRHLSKLSQLRKLRVDCILTAVRPVSFFADLHLPNLEWLWLGKIEPRTGALEGITEANGVPKLKNLHVSVEGTFPKQIRLACILDALQVLTSVEYLTLIGDEFMQIGSLSLLRPIPQLKVLHIRNWTISLKDLSSLKRIFPNLQSPIDLQFKESFL